MPFLTIQCASYLPNLGYLHQANSLPGNTRLMPRIPLCLFLFLVFLSSCKKNNTVPSEGASECIPFEAEQIVIDQLNEQYTYLFDGANPLIADPALDPLIEYLGEANFVGLGESTHGTKEFYQLKDKIFRRLVQEKGFQAIIFEIPWGNAMVVNDFVTEGLGSADAAVNQTYYCTYDTQEVRDLAHWMFDYNGSLADDDKILFVGCDPQGKDFQEERRFVAQLIGKVQPDSTARVLSHYANLPNELMDYSSKSEAIHQANIEGSQKVYDYLVANKQELVAGSSSKEYEIALMAAHLIQQRELIYRTNNFGAKRDQLMAFYAEWWQRILGQDSKVAIWAHNFHVADGADFGGQFMGTVLRQRHADTYKTVGFSFGTGSAMAFLAGKNREFQSGVQRQLIPELQCHTVNQVLSAVEGDQLYLIVEELRNEVFTYFNTTNSFVQFGAGFNYTYIDNYIINVKLSRLFDVLIHFDEANASSLK